MNNKKLNYRILKQITTCFLLFFLFTSNIFSWLILWNSFAYFNNKFFISYDNTSNEIVISFQNWTDINPWKFDIFFSIKDTVVWDGWDIYTPLDKWDPDPWTVNDLLEYWGDWWYTTWFITAQTRSYSGPGWSPLYVWIPLEYKSLNEIVRIPAGNYNQGDFVIVPDIGYDYTRVYWADKLNYATSTWYVVEDLEDIFTDIAQIAIVSGNWITDTTSVELTTDINLISELTWGVASWVTDISIPLGTEIKTSDNQSFDFTKLAVKKIETGSSAPMFKVQNNKWWVTFWIEWKNLVFNKPVKISFPVSNFNGSVMTVYAKHNGDANFWIFGLTSNPNATCAADWSANPPSVAASVSWGIATIYSCSASVFWWFTPSEIWSLTTTAFFNDDLTDATWSDYDNEQAALNWSGVLIFRIKQEFATWSTVTINLNNLTWINWVATWTIVSKVATYTGSEANAPKLLPAPNSSNWTEWENNFENDLWVANQCSLSANIITCTVPAWLALPKYSWIMLSWIQITNDSITTSWQGDSSSIVTIDFWWTAWASWGMRVALVRTWEADRTDWEWEWSAALDVEILSNISISVEQPSNLIIQPAAWSADRASSTGTVTVTTNSNGWYSVSAMNDWTWNTLRNIVDQSIVIPELPTTGTSWTASLVDNGFGVCPLDDDNAVCNFGTWTFYWIWATWNELYQEPDEEDTTAEITYHVDVTGTQKVGFYQGVITYLAAVNL